VRLRHHNQAGDYQRDDRHPDGVDEERADRLHDPRELLKPGRGAASNRHSDRQAQNQTDKNTNREGHGAHYTTTADSGSLFAWLFLSFRVGL